MSRIIVLEHKRNSEVAKATASDIFSYFERYNIDVINYNKFFEQFLDKDVKPNDIIMVYSHPPNEKDYDDRFKKIACKKVLRPVDGYNTCGRPLYKTIKNLERLEIEKVIYWHKNRNIDNFLKNNNNIKFRYMPHTLDFSNKRKVKSKKYDMSFSGQMHFEAYPVRTRIAHYYSKYNPDNINLIQLPWPGYEISNAKHDIIGEKYIDFLSQSWLGVTCRGGWRNGLIGKYLELGKAGSLPVCDIPDSMPNDMKELVVSIDETMDNSMINSKIVNTLENKKILKEKIENYQNLCEKYFDFKNVIPEMIKSIKEI